VQNLTSSFEAMGLDKLAKMGFDAAAGLAAAAGGFDKLQGNLAALIDALNKAKPATTKGVNLRKVAVSSTMGVGVCVDTQTIVA
jgi:hypothetical protein